MTHRLQVDGICVTDRVREMPDSLEVVLAVRPMILLVTSWDTREHIDEWIGAVIEFVRSQAEAAGKYVHVTDPQHIMTA